MRLPREMVKHIADALVSAIEARGVAKLLKPGDAVSQKIIELITGDLMAEDRLDKEVKNILASHEQEIAAGRMDYRKLFEMTKQKLARERGMVL